MRPWEEVIVIEEPLERAICEIYAKEEKWNLEARVAALGNIGLRSDAFPYCYSRHYDMKCEFHRMRNITNIPYETFRASAVRAIGIGNRL